MGFSKKIDLIHYFQKALKFLITVIIESQVYKYKQ